MKTACVLLIAAVAGYGYWHNLQPDKSSATTRVSPHPISQAVRDDNTAQSAARAAQNALPGGFHIFMGCGRDNLTQCCIVPAGANVFQKFVVTNLPNPGDGYWSVQWFQSSLRFETSQDALDWYNQQSSFGLGDRNLVGAQIVP